MASGLSKKIKQLNPSAPDSKGELSTLYRWIGGTSSQIDYSYSQQSDSSKWICACKLHMPSNKEIILETQSVPQSRKKDSMHEASKLMIKEILKQALPIPLIVINDDKSTTLKQPKTNNTECKPKTNDLKINNDDALLLEEHKQESRQPIQTHVSSFISTPFSFHFLENDISDKYIPNCYVTTKNDEYVSCFIYYIKYESDPYNTPIGLILPMKIDEHDLRSIKFPVQIRKNEEKQLKQLINEWAATEEKISDTDVKFDESYIHDTHVSMRSVKAKGGKYEHKLKKEYFNIIKACDKFMFSTLDPTITPLSDKNKMKQRRFYYICPLKNVFSGSDDMEIDYQFIDRIYLGLGGTSMPNKRLNAKEFRSKLRTSCNLKNEVVEIAKKNKQTQIAISYGVEKRKFEQIRS